MEPIGEFLAMLDRRTQAELSDLNRQSANLLTFVIVISAALLACIVALVFVLTHRVVRPKCSPYGYGFRKIGAGDLSARTDISGNDEIGVLGHGNRLHGQQSGLRDQRGAPECRRGGLARTREDKSRSTGSGFERLTTMGTNDGFDRTRDKPAAGRHRDKRQCGSPLAVA